MSEPLTPEEATAAQERRAQIAQMPAATFVQEISKIDPVTWGMQNRMIRGRRYGFMITEAEKQQRSLWRYHRPFLQKPLSDLRKTSVTRKSRQGGLSENALTKNLWFCATHKSAKVIHTFPREHQVKRFVNTRIDPALKETDQMKALLGKPDDTFLKAIGESFLLMVSAWSSDLGENIDADKITFDEYDRMKQGVETAFTESLASSNYGEIDYVSTPTLPGVGVDRHYGRSDQNIWMMKCEACGKWQHVTYPASVHQIKDYPLDAKNLPKDSWEYICKKCKRPRIDRWKGFWYSQKPENNEVAGYQFNQMMYVWLTATELMQKKIDFKYLHLFYNYVLGLPYRSDDVLAGETDFERCAELNPGWRLVGSRPHGLHRVSAGIDWGNISYVVVFGEDQNGRTYLLDAMIVPAISGQPLQDAKDIGDRLEKLQPDIIVADSGYGKDSNAYLLKRFPGIFYANSHPRTPKGSRLFMPQWNEDRHQVNSDKTLILKNVCNLFRQHETTVMPHRSLYDSVDSLIRHFGNLILCVDEDKDTEGGGGYGEYEYIDSRDDDHLALASAYAYMGLERYDVEGGEFDFIFC